jgi:formyltetrahydrofolate deformylase
MSKYQQAILLISCPDQRGIISAVTDFISEYDGNILDLDEHVDREHKVFFMRVAWDLANFKLSKTELNTLFAQSIAEKYRMNWQVHYNTDRPKMAIFVSKLSHCLYDILGRYQSGEWQVDIPLIISNHEHLKEVADLYQIHFHHIPVTKETKSQQESIQIELLQKHQIELVVLARYMQILSSNFVDQFPNRIINIHHSFLPAFPGAKPYHSAYDRGVKIIGASSHYVTEHLDAGPIIEQDVVRISHKNEIPELVRKGKDLEKIVLSRAIYLHLKRKILVYKNRTIIFD